MEEMMRFHQKDFEIPQVCLDLGFEDRSYHNDRSARMYNPQLDLTLWVNEPSAGKKRYVLQDCSGGMLGEVETDEELCKLVAAARTPCFTPRRYSHP
jgi:hypothetical protein